MWTYLSRCRHICGFTKVSQDYWARKDCRSLSVGLPDYKWNIWRFGSVMCLCQGENGPEYLISCWDDFSFHPEPWTGWYKNVVPALLWTPVQGAWSLLLSLLAEKDQETKLMYQRETSPLNTKFWNVDYFSLAFSTPEREVEECYFLPRRTQLSAVLFISSEEAQSKMSTKLKETMGM